MIVVNWTLYYLVIIPISSLPFPILYFLSDILYYPLYYIFGYRKKVSLENLRKSFPEKSEEERIAICKKYYRHFCDLALESLKAFTISQSEVKKRVKFIENGLLQRYFREGRSVIIAGGHYNNWELFAVGVDDDIPHQSVGIYTPFTNKFFDRKMQTTRSRYGLMMIANRTVKEFFREHRNELTATIFAIDQSPSPHSTPYWTTFLNQDTAVLQGVERYAMEYNFPVVFGRISKIKRGYYAYEFIDAVEQPKEARHGEITELVTRMLEADIREKPEFWLWSHRRWKHARPAPVAAAI